ncbi:S1 RNA-binding domain-containing protein [Streptomyces exfoliatus]|uniref:S1 RNA-binding domain-containing protein n=1 Tax=Streptomyces exfoliatus TaxID=1905 RepID=A0ABV3D200_STREX
MGQELRGTVEEVLSFGIIVDLGDGISGLVPFREVHGRRSAVNPVEDFEVGGKIAAVVTEIDPPTRRPAGFASPGRRVAGTKVS